MIDVLIHVNGVPWRVPADLTLAAALHRLGHLVLRTSEHGQPRAVHCAMGVCYECRVTVDGVEGMRACLVTVREGLTVELPRV